MPINYENLLSLEDENKEEWNYQCPYCKSPSLLIHPVGVSYRPHTINTFSGLPDEVVAYLKSLPNIVNAVLKTLEKDGSNRDVLVECLDCKTTTRGFWNAPPVVGKREKNIHVNKTKLTKYLRKVYGVTEVMIL